MQKNNLCHFSKPKFPKFIILKVLLLDSSRQFYDLLVKRKDKCRV